MAYRGPGPSRASGRPRAVPHRLPFLAAASFGMLLVAGDVGDERVGTRYDPAVAESFLKALSAFEYGRSLVRELRLSVEELKLGMVLVRDIRSPEDEKTGKWC